MQYISLSKLKFLTFLYSLSKLKFLTFLYSLSKLKFLTFLYSLSKLKFLTFLYCTLYARDYKNFSLQRVVPVGLSYDKRMLKGGYRGRGDRAAGPSACLS